jgi:hypothetical protein
MHSKAPIALLLLAMAAVPAAAAEEAKPADGPVSVELPQILAPMVVQGRLRGYAYLTIALTPAARDKVLLLREKVPFIQDAILREVNKGSIAKADDPGAVDIEATKARILARLGKVLPAGTVSDLAFEKVVMAPVQPES